MAGKFITFEGGEGSGKTTQIKLLQKQLNDAGKKSVLTREPGGCAPADAIRKLLLTGSVDKWHPVAETLLFQAARVEHVERVIKPALERGEIVICDRFLDSTIVYQGIAKGLGVEYIKQLHQFTLGSFAPDLTLILDIEPEIGLKRAHARAGDETRFENMELEFHRNVRNGFLKLAHENPPRYKIINADQSVKDVHKSILEAVNL